MMEMDAQDLANKARAEAQRQKNLALAKAELEVRRRAAAARAAASQRRAQTSASIGQRLRDNLLGDDDPSTQNLGERIGSTLNKAGEAMTFGLIGDETGAGLVYTSDAADE